MRQIPKHERAELLKSIAWLFGLWTYNWAGTFIPLASIGIGVVGHIMMGFELRPEPTQWSKPAAGIALVYGFITFPLWSIYLRSHETAGCTLAMAVMANLGTILIIAARDPLVFQFIFGFASFGIMTALRWRVLFNRERALRNWNKASGGKIPMI